MKETEPWTEDVYLVREVTRANQTLGGGTGRAASLHRSRPPLLISFVLDVVGLLGGRETARDELVEHNRVVESGKQRDRINREASVAP